MLLRGFYFLLVLIVIVLPTWALWQKEHHIFNRNEAQPLNDNFEDSALRKLPVILSGLLLFAVFGFAYPNLGIFRNLLLTTVVSASLFGLLHRVLMTVKCNVRTRQIFDAWLESAGAEDTIWFGCGGYSRRLFIQNDYIVFSINDYPMGKLSSAVQSDMNQLYGQIHYVEGKAFARVGPTPESLKDILRCCKAFPRAEHVSLTSGPDSICIRL